MPRFCANISMLFTELPMVERPAAARAAGFEAIEVQFPYEVPLDDFARAAEDAGVKVALINFPAGDFDKGDRGLGALPLRVAEFRAGVAEGRRYAERLGVDRFNLLAGIPGPERRPDKDARAALIDNLRFAAKAVASIGATVCLEAINTRDVPGFYLHDPDQVVALIDEAGVVQRGAAVRHLSHADHARRPDPDDGTADAGASATSSSPTRRDATSRAPARSTSPPSSRRSTASATPAGWGPNTSPRTARPAGSAGLRHGARAPAPVKYRHEVHPRIFVVLRMDRRRRSVHAGAGEGRAGHRHHPVPVDLQSVYRPDGDEELRAGHGAAAARHLRQELGAGLHALHRAADHRERPPQAGRPPRRQQGRRDHLHDPRRRQMGRRPPGDDRRRPARLGDRPPSRCRGRVGSSIFAAPRRSTCGTTRPSPSTSTSSPTTRRWSTPSSRSLSHLERAGLRRAEGLPEAHGLRHRHDQPRPLYRPLPHHAGRRRARTSCSSPTRHWYGDKPHLQAHRRAHDREHRRDGGQPAVRRHRLHRRRDRPVARPGARLREAARRHATTSPTSPAWSTSISTSTSTTRSSRTGGCGRRCSMRSTARR